RNCDGTKRESGERTAREDRRRHNGLQKGVGGGGRRSRKGRRMAAREGSRRGGRPSRPGRIRGICRFVYSCGWQAWGVDRSQLRNRFLRQVGSVPGAGEGTRDAGGGGQSALRATRGAVPGRYRAGAADLRAPLRALPVG